MLNEQCINLLIKDAKDEYQQIILYFNVLNKYIQQMEYIIIEKIAFYFLYQLKIDIDFNIDGIWDNLFRNKSIIF